MLIALALIALAVLAIGLPAALAGAIAGLLIRLIWPRRRKP